MLFLVYVTKKSLEFDKISFLRDEHFRICFQCSFPKGFKSNKEMEIS